MFKIKSESNVVTEATELKEALNRAENARLMGISNITIESPEGQVINYYS